jgi:CDP-glycerol glycerophosphotransferase (TagB/SpsB family)
MYGERDKEYFAHVTGNDSSIRKNIKFWEVGYPKYDYHFKTNEPEKSSIKSLIGLNDKKATILYAPAWDPCGIHRTKGIELIKVFKKLHAYNFIIKLHPALLTSKRSSHYDFYTGGIDWYSEIKNATSGLSFRKQNVFFPDIDSINPLINVSNLLLTDFSGVALGFFLENKPVICIDCPDFYSKTLVELGSDGQLSKSNHLFNNGRNASHIVKNINELPKSIPHVLSNPAEMEKERMEIASKLLFNPGEGTKVFLKTLNTILKS